MADGFPTTKPWWVSNEAWERIKVPQAGKPPGARSQDILFDEYQRFRGGLNQAKFVRQGYPDPPVALTPYARDILERTGGVPKGVTVAEPPTPGQISIAERMEALAPEREAAGVDLKGAAEIPPFPTEPAPPGFEWRFDRDLNRWVPQFAGLTAQQRAGRELSEQELELQRQQQAGFPSPTTQPPTDAFGRTATWNARLGQWDYPPNWGQRQGDQPDPFRQQQFEEQQRQFEQQLQFQQEQARQQAELQRQQEMARLQANPINWLQYAAFTGQQPVVQPWMIPLGFQQFGQGGAPQMGPQGQAPQGQATTQAGQPLQIGQPIPELQDTQFSTLPQLRTPSAQLQARWGPTAQAQYLGFERARTGAAPQETQFRLGSQRAPAGRFTGFSRFR